MRRARTFQPRNGANRATDSAFGTGRRGNVGGPARIPHAARHSLIAQAHASTSTSTSTSRSKRCRVSSMTKRRDRDIERRHDDEPLGESLLRLGLALRDAAQVLESQVEEHLLPRHRNEAAVASRLALVNDRSLRVHQRLPSAPTNVDHHREMRSSGAVSDGRSCASRAALVVRRRRRLNAQRVMRREDVPRPRDGRDVAQLSGAQVAEDVEHHLDRQRCVEDLLCVGLSARPQRLASCHRTSVAFIQDPAHLVQEAFEQRCHGLGSRERGVGGRRQRRE